LRWITEADSGERVELKPKTTLPEWLFYPAAASGALGVLVGPMGAFAAALYAVTGILLIVAGGLVLGDVSNVRDALYERARRPPGYRAMASKSLPVGSRRLFAYTYGGCLVFIGCFVLIMAAVAL
jgi:hypothetical protein